MALVLAPGWHPRILCSGMYVKYGPGAWAGHSIWCLQLAPSAWSWRSAGSWSLGRKVAQEFSLPCTHCELLGARGEVVHHSLQGHSGDPLQVMACEWLTARVWDGVQDQYGCWCGCALRFHCFPLQDGVGSIPELPVVWKLQELLVQESLICQSQRLLPDMSVTHPHTCTTHPYTPLSLFYSLTLCWPPCWDPSQSLSFPKCQIIPAEVVREFEELNQMEAY